MRRFLGDVVRRWSRCRRRLRSRCRARVCWARWRLSRSSRGTGALVHRGQPRRSGGGADPARFPRAGPVPGSPRGCRAAVAGRPGTRWRVAGVAPGEGPVVVRGVAAPGRRPRPRRIELAARWPAYFVAFDVPQLDGVKLLSRPYRERLALLEALSADHGLTAPLTPSATRGRGRHRGDLRRGPSVVLLIDWSHSCWSAGRGRGGTEVTFVLPREDPPGPMSVVEDFIDWRPGAHTLQPRKDGKRAVAVALAGGHPAVPLPGSGRLLVQRRERRRRQQPPAHLTVRPEPGDFQPTSGALPVHR